MKALTRTSRIVDIQAVIAAEERRHRPRKALRRVHIKMVCQQLRRETNWRARIAMAVSGFMRGMVRP